MGQIKNNAYTLYIYNGGVDSPNSDAKIGIRYNKLTKIDNNGTKLNLSLFGLSFHRKIYEPGLINAEIQITVVPDDNGNIKIPDINILENYFIRKKVELKVSVPDKATATTYTLAENYYIHEIHPLYERNVNNTYIYLKLTIRSMDNLMCLNKFSEAYLGRQFRSYIVANGIKDYATDLKLSENDTLQHLSINNEEFVQPYLVQYNESFYDFIVRIANRCGEFVYFEDGEFHIGINPNKTLKNVDNYSRITYHNISAGPLNINDYTHDSINKNESDEYDKYTYYVENYKVNLSDYTISELEVWREKKDNKYEYYKKEYKWNIIDDNAYKAGKEEYYKAHKKEEYAEICNDIEGNPYYIKVNNDAKENVKKENASQDDYNIYKGYKDENKLNSDEFYYIKESDKIVKGKKVWTDDDNEYYKNNFSWSIISENEFNKLENGPFKYKKDGETHTIRKYNEEGKTICIKIDENTINKAEKEVATKDDFDKAKKYNAWVKPDTSSKSTFNISPVEKTIIYPTQKVYNTEVAVDEFFMPLYRDQFSDGEVIKYIKDNGGSLFSHFLDTISDPNVIDMVSDNLQYAATTVVHAAVNGDSDNEKGNKNIDLWETKNADMAVPFVSSNEKSTWTTLEYYHDIKSYEENQQRQTICIDMDSEILVSGSPLNIGDIVTLTGNSCKYIVVEIEMQGDLPWQRKYDGYGNADLTSNEAAMKSRLKFYAIPVAVNNVFYPPVLPKGAFRKSDPQHAIVVDSSDPKRLGRVRIRYPWQSHQTEGSEKDNILDDAATPWIRMVTPMATGGGGMYFKPEVGDEVLVNFENGNIERPYVVGTLYSKNNVTPNANRIIQSPNGHFIKMEDPTDASKLLTSTLPIFKFLKDWYILPDFKIEYANQLLGGITISDAYGMYLIKMSSQQRRVEISSSFGDVKINALTGITISAPKGNVKIEGKNIDICAGNRVTIKSGANIGSKSFLDGLGTSKIDVAKTIANRLDNLLGDIIDLSIMRTLMEIVLKPVNGTLQLHSNSFLVLEAGNCTAEIPETAYKERALATKNLSYTSNAYQALSYIASVIANVNISECSREVARLYNDACDKLSVLHSGDITNIANDKNIFSDGLGYITNMTADDFVKKSMETKLYVSIWKAIKWQEGFKNDKFAKKVKAAYQAVHALKKYCETITEMFTHFSKLKSASVYKLLNDKFIEALSHDSVKNIDWVKKIREIGTGDTVVKYDYFVRKNFVKRKVEISTNRDYASGIDKVFKRCLCYLILGDSWHAPGIEPINKTEFIKSRNLQVDSINVDNGHSVVTKVNDIIYNNNNGWADYINSLKLKDTSEDQFGKAFKQSIYANLDKKALTYIPEYHVWKADVKGNILMSDSSDTISLDHSGVGNVQLKADANSQLSKKTLDEAEKYLRKLLISVGE